jgi:hypothetical protein
MKFKKSAGAGAPQFHAVLGSRQSRRPNQNLRRWLFFDAVGNKKSTKT